MINSSDYINSDSVQFYYCGTEQKNQHRYVFFTCACLGVVVVVRSIQMLLSQVLLKNVKL